MLDAKKQVRTEMTTPGHRFDDGFGNWHGFTAEFRPVQSCSEEL